MDGGTGERTEIGLLVWLFRRLYARQDKDTNTHASHWQCFRIVCYSCDYFIYVCAIKHLGFATCLPVQLLYVVIFIRATQIIARGPS